MEIKEIAEKILVLDFGGQYCHLIARRIRDLGVYSDILPYDASLDTIKQFNPKGIILSGGPSSVYEPDSPQLSSQFWSYVESNKIPLLGLCYGHQLIAHILGGKVEPNSKKEFGKTDLHVILRKEIFARLEEHEIVWMSHGDQVVKLPPGYVVYASTETCPIAAYGNPEKKIFAAQFHPEVQHTVHGLWILEDFLKLCVKERSWKMDNWIEKEIEAIRKTVGSDHVILGLSGGVDSSVVAVMLHKAIGDQVHPVFVNNGLLRKNEVESVVKIFRDEMKFKNFKLVDAEAIFLERLKGVTEPEEKRKIIGHTFIEVFEQAAKDLSATCGNLNWLAQGTIFPDRVETKATSKVASKIKSHHNVTLPENMKFKLIEPIRDLYKDEVRKIGKILGLPDYLLNRHPFPGPGLAVRLLGDITKERLNLLREADAIVQEELRKAGVYEKLWQAFAVYLPVKSVGVMGDFRTYENICAVRIVESIDAMTANFAKLDWNILEKISTRIINECRGFNRVVYDISNKPPATIEFE